ncbi:ATP-binding protein [Phenylobacterium terrae]|uniref:histidine kinase n=1 Tax=Phenylobacterium terrae TaxID=2665495 RepID=A0ABW4MZD3_9CAUL
MCESGSLAAVAAFGGRRALDALVNAVPIALMVTDRDMRVLAVSPRWIADVGLPREAIVGRTVYELAPDYFERFRPAYERCLAGEAQKHDRVRSPRNDGGVDWLQTELSPWYDDHGQIGGLISAAVHITHMVEALERTELSEQRLQLALEAADMHVWEIDYRAGTVTTAGAAETFFDYDVSTDEFMRDTNVTIHPDHRERIAEEWRAAVAQDLPYRPEYRVHRLDGKEVWATCTVKLVKDENGHPHRLIGAMQNITARKQAEAAMVRAKEEAELANQAKSAFLATISHEIRTPLNGVLGMAQAIAADELAPLQRERLEVLRQSGETLLALLNDVLDLSKIEAGKLELELADFDIAQLARGAHASFTALAERKGLDFSLVVEDAAQGSYRGDSTRVRQILYNLVSNAVKFTEAGAVGVCVAAGEGGLRLTVSDTGIGIPPDRIGRLFQKFEQADASTTRRYGGTGLGLAICRDLVELMGGKITIASREGVGTTFTVDLPLPRVGEALPEAAESPPADQAADLRTLRVLAAEDNPVNQLVLKTLLHQAGIDPLIVGDGAQALEAWRREHWDVVLLDVQMPVMDGPTTAQAIRAEEARTGRAHTPLVAITANAMSHQIAEYRAVGMDGFVAKPIEVATLFDALERVLAGADASEAA